MQRICLLKDMYVHVAANGKEWIYKLDTSGVETELVKEGLCDRNKRVYFCENCGFVTEGESEEAFDVVREHLGKVHEFIQPFNMTLWGNLLDSEKQNDGA